MLRLRELVMKKNKNYTPSPPVPPAQVERLALVVEVLAGQTTVSEAARVLGMSRNHFQTILHRGLEGLLEGIGPKMGGRPAKPKELAKLEAQVMRLRRENEQLKDRVGTTDRLLEVASGLLHGRIKPTVRASRQKKTKGAPSENKPDEPDAARSHALRGVREMTELGLSAAVAARVAGVHAATVRRWRARERRGEPLARRVCAKAMTLTAPIAQRAGELVRRLHGLVGAEALRRSVAGISRRQAATLKAQTLSAMERERKRALTRVTVTASGVMRGLDGMHLRTRDGVVHALFLADAAVPYRTGVYTAKRYDAELVARALCSDIEQHGAPLVYRLDRASSHDAPPVHEILQAHEVLVLHGPPRCPRFYGQHERQNREHRAWQEDLALLALDEIEANLHDMLDALNKLWRRRSLGWNTAYEAWCARPELHVDRRALCEEVAERTFRIRRHFNCRGKPADLANRLAIEQALVARGYLRKQEGGWC
jgi:transposase-like protein